MDMRRELKDTAIAAGQDGDLGWESTLDFGVTAKVYDHPAVWTARIGINDCEPKAYLNPDAVFKHYRWAIVADGKRVAAGTDADAFEAVCRAYEALERVCGIDD